MLENFEPKDVFYWFEELSKIPRCSRQEKKVSDFLVDFAKKRNFEVYQDYEINVIIKKPATPGYESKPTIIMQGHMDMVCEKVKGSSHNFCEDSLKLQAKDGWISAEGTTLGGDDGILIIAGTGSIGLAKIGENTYRCGGFGYRYGDEGSAYSIGKAIISAALKESDGRNKKSKIYDLVLEYFKMNSVNDIATSDFTREHIAGLAAEASKYIYSCESIKIIFERAAGEITLHIKALSKKFENKIKLSYIGGVFKSEFIMKMIKEMNPDIDIVSPIFPPEKGSILQV